MSRPDTVKESLEKRVKIGNKKTLKNAPKITIGKIAEKGVKMEIIKKF